jgi:hypothetical protein
MKSLRHILNRMRLGGTVASLRGLSQSRIYQPRKSAEKSRRAGVGCEMLEERLLLSTGRASAVVDNDTLKVVGTSKADDIRVSSVQVENACLADSLVSNQPTVCNVDIQPESKQLLKVEINNLVSYFYPEDVQEISISGMAGRDVIHVDEVLAEMTSRPSGVKGEPVITIMGGAGDDRLEYAGSLPVQMHGGDGDDTLISGSGDDELNGGDGNDKIDAGAGDDTVIGGRGKDSLDGGSGDNKVEDQDAERQRRLERKAAQEAEQERLLGRKATSDSKKRR